MKEVQQEVRTFQIYMTCICGGNMKFEGVALTSNPPKYPHKCEACSLKANLPKIYPYVDYQPIQKHKD